MGNVFFLDGFGEDPPGRRILEGTDLEIAYRLEGDDLVLQVNKGPVQVFRVRLGDARKPMSDVQLGTYNAVAPDLRFMIFKECGTPGGTRERAGAGRAASGVRQRPGCSGRTHRLRVRHRRAAWRSRFLHAACAVCFLGQRHLKGFLSMLDKSSTPNRAWARASWQSATLSGRYQCIHG